MEWWVWALIIGTVLVVGVVLYFLLQTRSKAGTSSSGRADDDLERIPPVAAAMNVMPGGTATPSATLSEALTPEGLSDDVETDEEQANRSND